MPAESSQLKKVLFVDDNLQFLEMIERLMGAWSKGEWEIFVAQNSGKALLILQEQAIDMAVVDIQMPVVDGIQFLALLNRKYPHIQKVTLSAYADEASRTACLNHGAELFLEKPRNPGDLEIIFSTLRELARQQPVTRGFSGVLRQVSLDDVIQMECLNRNSSVLEVADGQMEGRIFIKDGTIIHAEIGERNGESAFNRILSLRGGEFNLKPFTDPPECSIDANWEFLLMEAARSRDEASEPSAAAEDDTAATLMAAEAPPADIIPDNFNLFQAAPATSEPLEPPPIAKPPPSAKPLPKLPSKPLSKPAPKPLPESDFVPFLPVPAPPVRSPQLPPSPMVADPARTAKQPVRIDEMVVCSSQGEVLYEWKSGNANERVSFLEFLSQKSNQLGEGLNLGMFDRLEMEGELHRVIAQVRSDRGTFVRVTRHLGQPAAENTGAVA